MNKFRIIINIILIVCIIAVIGGLAWVSLDVDEERLSGCESICEDKNMEYYTYEVDMKSMKATVFCSCLDNGLENKFVLTRKSE